MKKVVIAGLLALLAGCAHAPDEPPHHECTANNLLVAPGTGKYQGKTAILPVNPCGYAA